MNSKEDNFVSQLYTEMLIEANGNKSLTLDQIAEVYGITRERVRQIIMRTIAKLKHHKSKKLRDVFIESLQKERVSSLYCRRYKKPSLEYYDRGTL